MTQGVLIMMTMLTIMTMTMRMMMIMRKKTEIEGVPGINPQVTSD